MFNAALDDEARIVWLAALHQLALADGDFDESESQILADRLNDDSSLQPFDWNHCQAPDLDDISRHFSTNPKIAEEFLQSAVTVALADGYLHQSELDLLLTWARALVGKSPLISSLVSCPDYEARPWRLLDSIKQWLDAFDPSDERISSLIVQLIPSQCPFERDIVLFGRRLVHIPPICKVNPLFDQLVALRFRCLNHLPLEDQMRISLRDSIQE